jgi:hypothetical protein
MFRPFVFREGIGMTGALVALFWALVAAMGAAAALAFIVGMGSGK